MNSRGIIKGARLSLNQGAYMKGHKINRAQRLAIETLLSQGVSVAIIAQALNLSQSAVYRFKNSLKGISND